MGSWAPWPTGARHFSGMNPLLCLTPLLPRGHLVCHQRGRPIQRAVGAAVLAFWAGCRLQRCGGARLCPDRLLHLPAGTRHALQPAGGLAGRADGDAHAAAHTGSGGPSQQDLSWLYCPGAAGHTPGHGSGPLAPLGWPRPHTSAGVSPGAGAVRHRRRGLWLCGSIPGAVRHDAPSMPHPARRRPACSPRRTPIPTLAVDGRQRRPLHHSPAAAAADGEQYNRRRAKRRRTVGRLPAGPAAVSGAHRHGLAPITKAAQPAADAGCAGAGRNSRLPVVGRLDLVRRGLVKNRRQSLMWLLLLGWRWCWRWDRRCGWPAIRG